MKKGMKKCEILMQYEPPEFKQALEVLNACAAEGWFNEEVDCTHCPARKSCLKFWDNFVANTDSKNVIASKAKQPDHYLETIAHKFNELLDKKHGYEDIWIEKLPPIPPCHCERSEAISSPFKGED